MHADNAVSIYNVMMVGAYSLGSQNIVGHTKFTPDRSVAVHHIINAWYMTCVGNYQVHNEIVHTL